MHWRLAYTTACTTIQAVFTACTVVQATACTVVQATACTVVQATACTVVQAVLTVCTVVSCSNNFSNKHGTVVAG